MTLRYILIYQDVLCHTVPEVWVATGGRSKRTVRALCPTRPLVIDDSSMLPPSRSAAFVFDLICEFTALPRERRAGPGEYQSRILAQDSGCSTP